MRAFTAVLAFGFLAVVSACGGDDDADPAGSGGTGGASAVCERGCVATLAADCPQGPADQASCVSTCETLSSGPCKTEYAAFQTCAEGKAITCGSNGIPVVEECAAEQTAFIDCLT
jgi:hypothetical protein